MLVYQRVMCHSSHGDFHVAAKAGLPLFVCVRKPTCCHHHLLPTSTLELYNSSHLSGGSTLTKWVLGSPKVVFNNEIPSETSHPPTKYVCKCMHVCMSVRPSVCLYVCLYVCIVNRRFSPICVPCWY